jgi:hypothetical protein
MLLEHLLTDKPTSFDIRHLLWQIFEGNDLEESYESFSSIHSQNGNNVSKVFKGTLIDTLASIPRRVKDQSVIHRFISGRIVLNIPSSVREGMNPYMVDGIRLMVPLYHSAQHAYRLFYPPYIERASETEAYLMRHPNRDLLDKTFRDMAALGKKYRFKVTIVIAPSAARLYGLHFGEFPPISREPYFINYVEKLAYGLGFDVVNLYSLMQSYAKEELLYWRDDTHWNERGHQVVAEIIAKHLWTVRAVTHCCGN